MIIETLSTKVLGIYRKPWFSVSRLPLAVSLVLNKQAIPVMIRGVMDYG